MASALLAAASGSVPLTDRLLCPAVPPAAGATAAPSWSARSGSGAIAVASGALTAETGLALQAVGSALCARGNVCTRAVHAARAPATACPASAFGCPQASAQAAQGTHSCSCRHALTTAGGWPGRRQVNAGAGAADTCGKGVMCARRAAAASVVGESTHHRMLLQRPCIPP